MPFEILEVGGVPVHMWLPEGHEVEVDALLQLGKTSRLPCVTRVACMPDVHLGKGATVGSVVATERAIIPSAVGVDIGCGMIAQQLSVFAHQLPDNLEEIRAAIEASVPHGRTNDGRAGDRGAWGEPPSRISQAWRSLSQGYDEIVDKYPKIHHKYTLNHLGTLGTGNHFIELCLDENQQVWIMLHSGSRGIGNKIGSFFIARAKEQCEKAGIGLEDRDLAFLTEGEEWFDDYVQAVSWGQNFAKTNRQVMMGSVLKALLEMTRAGKFPEFHMGEVAVNCHHNYVERETHAGQSLFVTRKGAVRARAGDLGIIPGSMGAKSFIVRGLGNPDTLHSCSHGAGRTMSRTAAKKAFTVEDLVEQTKGVECRKDEGVLDEIPGAYKSIDAVIDVQKEHGIIEVMHTLKQILCVKG